MLLGCRPSKWGLHGLSAAPYLVYACLGAAAALDALFGLSVQP